MLETEAVPSFHESVTELALAINGLNAGVSDI